VADGGRLRVLARDPFLSAPPGDVPSLEEVRRILAKVRETATEAVRAERERRRRARRGQRRALRPLPGRTLLARATEGPPFPPGLRAPLTGRHVRFLEEAVVKVTEMKVADVRAGARHRRPGRQIDALKASIAARGLLQPLAVWPDGALACGSRRREAVRQLGWETVPVHVLTGLDDLLARLKAEADENTCRLDLLPSEAVALARKIAVHEEEAAKGRQQKGGKKAGRGRPTGSGNLPEPVAEEDAGDTRDKVAEVVGMSGKTYEHARAVVEAAQARPEDYGDLAAEMDSTGKVARAYRKLRQRQKEAEPPAPAPAGLGLSLQGGRWRVDQADCLEWLAGRPADGIDLVFGSPPYEDARLYLEGGKDLGIARTVDEWVAWMVEVYGAALRCCKGVVCFVVDGPTKDYRWSAAPFLLGVALHQKGICLRKPPVYRRVGIPGSGGPDWLRNDYEFIVCATRGGRLPWSDNTAMGAPPKFQPGGDPSHRRRDGTRVNRFGEEDGYAAPGDRANHGPHRARQRGGDKYNPPERANPGNVISCPVGGGNMGDRLCHENEAPFPEYLAEFFVRSFCPPGGVVADCFCGSGTTGKAALAHGRLFLGCDIRASQVELTKKRLESVQPALFPEACCTTKHPCFPRSGTAAPRGGPSCGRWSSCSRSSKPWTGSPPPRSGRRTTPTSAGTRGLDSWRSGPR
jgi:ParB-like chromosome segregation protein Spo0J